jgi:hypothetical protein
MGQQIFDLKLSVEGTSLYLLITGLFDAGVKVNREVAVKVWNAPEEQIDQVFVELVARGVAGVDANGNWYLRSATDWR